MKKYALLGISFMLVLITTFSNLTASGSCLPQLHHLKENHLFCTSANLVLDAATLTAQKEIDKVLIADETYYAPSGKNFKITTSNTEAIQRLQPLSTYCYRITTAAKKDRLGVYWEHSYYFYDKHYSVIERILLSLKTSRFKQSWK